MTSGNYLYGITEHSTTKTNFTGLMNDSVFEIQYKEISAIISPVPYKEVNPNLDNITTHQNVIEEIRKTRTVIPVRFGVILKDREGVKKLLETSHREYKEKLDKFKKSDEFGVKIALDEKGLTELRRRVESDSREISGIKTKISESTEGTAYFLNLRLEEAIKNQLYHKIDEKINQVHQELCKYSIDNRKTNESLDKIVMNSAYLVNQDNKDEFIISTKKLKKEYEKYGFILHTSGPWAPYSFC